MFQISSSLNRHGWSDLPAKINKTSVWLYDSLVKEPKEQKRDV